VLEVQKVIPVRLELKVQRETQAKPVHKAQLDQMVRTARKVLREILAQKVIPVRPVLKVLREILAQLTRNKLSCF